MTLTIQHLRKLSSWMGSTAAESVGDQTALLASNVGMGKASNANNMKRVYWCLCQVHFCQTRCSSNKTSGSKELKHVEAMLHLKGWISSSDSLSLTAWLVHWVTSRKLLVAQAFSRYALDPSDKVDSVMLTETNFKAHELRLKVLKLLYN